MITALLTPPIGFAVDKIGKRSFIIIAAGLCINVSHFYIMVLPETHSNAYEFGIVMMGIGYAIMVGSILSSIPYKFI